MRLRRQRRGFFAVGECYPGSAYVDFLRQDFKPSLSIGLVEHVDPPFRMIEIANAQMQPCVPWRFPESSWIFRRFEPARRSFRDGPVAKVRVRVGFKAFSIKHGNALLACKQRNAGPSFNMDKARR